MVTLLTATRSASCMLFVTGLVGCVGSDELLNDVEVNAVNQAVTGNCPANADQYSFHFDNEGGSIGPSAGGYVSGWVFDNNTPDRSINLTLETGGLGYSYSCGFFTANQQRDDVNSYCGVTGAHGFSFVVPASCDQTYVFIDADGVRNIAIGVNFR